MPSQQPLPQSATDVSHSQNPFIATPQTPLPGITPNSPSDENDSENVDESTVGLSRVDHKNDGADEDMTGDETMSDDQDAASSMIVESVADQSQISRLSSSSLQSSAGFRRSSRQNQKREDGSSGVQVPRTVFAGPPLSQKFLQMASGSPQLASQLSATMSQNNPQNSGASAVASLSGSASLTMTSSPNQFNHLHSLVPRLQKNLQSSIYYPLYAHISCQSVLIYDIITKQMVQNFSLPLKNFIALRFMRVNGVYGSIHKEFLFLCTLEESLIKKDRTTSLTIWDVKKTQILSHLKLRRIKGRNVASVQIWENNYIAVASVKGEMELWKFSQSPVTESDPIAVHSARVFWKLELCWYWDFQKDLGNVESFSLSPFTKSKMALTCSDGLFFVKDFNPESPPTTLEKKFKVTQTKVYDLVWSPTHEDQLYLVTAKEIGLYDINLRKNILNGSIRSSATRSDFASIHFNSEDLTTMYTTHVDGTVCGWTWDSTKNKYVASFCDVIRGSKHGMDRPGSLVSVAFSPPTGDVIGYDIDGTLWFWTYDASRGKYKWVLDGFQESISSQVSSLQVSPFEDLLAVGTTSGDLYIYNLDENTLKFKYSLFDSIVQNITWSSPSSVVCSSSASTTNQNSNNNQSNNAHNTAPKNRLVSVSLFTGEILNMKNDKDAVSDAILGLRVSYSRKLLLVIQRNKPLELWNLADFEVVCYIPYPQSGIKSVNWCHSTDSVYDRLSDKSSEIFFICSSSSQPGDSISYYLIDDRTKEVTRFKDTRYPITNQMVEKNRFRVSSDQNGNLVVWNRRPQEEHPQQTGPYQLTSHKAQASKITFSPRGPYVSVLYHDGILEVWDLNSNKRLCTSPSRVEFVSCDWTSNNLLVCGKTNGAVMVFDILMRKCCDPMAKRSLKEPIQTPLLLPSMDQEALRYLLQHDQLKILNESDELPNFSKLRRNGYGEFTETHDPSDLEEKRDSPEQWRKVLEIHSLLIPPLVRTSLVNSTSLIERMLIIAQYFADSDTTKFWQLAQVHLRNLKDPQVTERLRKHVENVATRPDAEDYEEIKKPQFSKELPSIFGVFRDRESVQFDEQARLHAHDLTVRHLPGTLGANLYEQVAQDEAQFGHKDDAVKLLLQTPHDHKDMYINFFHACVCAAANSPEHFRQTVLYMTSSLIARRNQPQNTEESKDLSYAIELLCLIGETHRACRILQNSELWEKAAHLAQSKCSEDERFDILIRWANHLTRNNDKFRACLLWLNMGFLYNVLDLLYQLKMHSAAVSLLRIIEEEDIPIIRCKRRSVGVLSEKALSVASPEKENEPEREVSETEALNQLKIKVYEAFVDDLMFCKLYALADHYNAILAQLVKQTTNKTEETEEVVA
uniref:WDR11 TPR domain-containing protein n=1 Tax=Percolomonas cosmopolitus TaxID=63605 RepID=A0A7S1PG82_9EUKA|eukprot:CAMPEP_0117441836 /NCGR_PEP_ID=MMETSP0759-20121206/3839_1 /TAXON_ID=63605 /ORGANISM="Percolomonas cosmopolitus, Strain WS" /LENGTH=1363 /DNA_ID=CAMNT_0005233701 /DNA_START=211 /DNA_END=4302 /DNA_ORIENTATION=-